MPDEFDAEEGKLLDVSQVVSLAKFFVAEYAVLNDLDTEEIPRRLAIRDFHEFVRQWRLHYTAEEIAERIGVTAEQVEFCLDEVFGDPFNLLEIMQHLWPTVVHFGPPSSLRPRAVSTQVILLFEDDVATVFQAFTVDPAEALVSKGQLSTLLSMQASVLRQEIQDLGLQGLHAKGHRIPGLRQYLVANSEHPEQDSDVKPP